MRKGKWQQGTHTRVGRQAAGVQALWGQTCDMQALGGGSVGQMWGIDNKRQGSGHLTPFLPAPSLPGPMLLLAPWQLLDGEGRGM